MARFNNKTSTIDIFFFKIVRSCTSLTHRNQLYHIHVIIKIIITRAMFKWPLKKIRKLISDFFSAKSRLLEIQCVLQNRIDIRQQFNSLVHVHNL